MAADDTEPGVLAGRAVVVTGAGQGLGRAYAIHAAGCGAAVVVNDVDEARAHEVAEEIAAAGGTAVAAGHDVSDAERARDLIEVCQDAFGSVDGLINNAGRYHEALPWEEDPERLRALLAVNVLGTMYCGGAAAAAMARQSHGAMVNASSGGAFGFPGTGAYGASKAAILSLTYSWALDFEPVGLRVNAISPMAATRMTSSAFARSLVPADRTPERIAPLVTYLLSDRAAGVTGQFFRFDGQRLRVVPQYAFSEHPEVENAQWDVAAVDAALAGPLADHLAPYGVERVAPPRSRGR
ncbi:SDR family NAD(P)-dependent oxidoreductase [Salinactinospora qingdaonensis]|uniref:SDR family NAD(P)-dependent oxidoreductase n=1 Tax=Salinactinospora qingdaonensis TaxID=702744 RepID=UPI0031EFAE43